MIASTFCKRTSFCSLIVEGENGYMASMEQGGKKGVGSKMAYWLMPCGIWPRSYSHSLEIYLWKRVWESTTIKATPHPRAAVCFQFRPETDATQRALSTEGQVLQSEVTRKQREIQNHSTAVKTHGTISRYADCAPDIHLHY